MRRALTLLATSLALGCAPDPGRPDPSPGAVPATPVAEQPRRPSLRLLFIGIDGADWDVLRPLTASGQCPNIGRLVAQGASGTLLSPPPRISPMVWTTMMTGREPEDHGVLDFFAPMPGGGLVPVPATSRRAKEAWEILPEHGIACGSVGFWATWPASRPAEADAGERSVIVSDAFAPSLFGGAQKTSDLVWPEAWAGRLEPLRIHPARAGADLARFVGAGAAGTAPPTGVTDIEKDPVAHLERILRSTRLVQGAAMEIGKAGQVDALFVYHEMIDEVCHRFMRFAPPAMKGVADMDVERYGRAVLEAYKLEDDLVGELLALASPDTIVVLASDHGFLSGDKRPASDPSDFAGQAAAWHREEGIVIARAPGIAPTESLAGATIDVTPTLLALLKVPQASDMPGHALLGESALPRVPSYGGPTPTVAASRPADERLEEMKALGYVGPDESLPQVSANGYVNLGLSLAARGKREESRAAYRKALGAFENHPSALFDLGSSLAIDGKLDEAFPILVRLARLDTELPEGALLRLCDVAVKLGQSKVDDARKALDARPPPRRDGEWREAASMLPAAATAR